MKRFSQLLLCICSIFVMATSCTSYSSPEEEMQAILKKDGWELISNQTNVYRKDIDHRNSSKKKRIVYTTTYWYTASILCKQLGHETKYISARVVYIDDHLPKRENGKLVYKTFPIVECSYTDNYKRSFNGYISDGGSEAYLNF